MPTASATDKADQAISDNRSNNSLVSQTLRATAYAALESPALAVAQVIDHYSDGKAIDAVRDCFHQWGVEAPMPSEFGSKQWFADAVGSAVGMLLPFRAVKFGIGKTGLLGRSERLTVNS